MVDKHVNGVEQNYRKQFKKIYEIGTRKSSKIIDEYLICGNASFN